MRLALAAGLLALAPFPAAAACVDLNEASLEELQRIEHVGEAFAQAIIAGRPWGHVRELRQVRGIGAGRLRDIKEQALACVADPQPEVIRGRAVVLDGDTFRIDDERIRLIGIDAPETDQMCRLDELDWPCGQVSTAVMWELVGTEEVACEVHGRDRWERALGVCRREDGLDLNGELVRLGWALAWYPETGAIYGPDYEPLEAQAREAGRGMWKGEFTVPWEWRR